MPRVPTVEVDLSLLDVLFEEYSIWPKIRDGRIVSDVVPKSTVPSTKWPNAFSQIVKHFLPNGKHIATTHRVVGSDGTMHHQDAKDILFQGIRLWRR